MRIWSPQSLRVMRVVKPRNKTVMFRIAQEDYARLSTIVSASGARSFSDFARSQVLRVLGEPSLADIGQRLSELELTVQQLTEALQRTRPSG
jgi:hypothetical protein